MNHSTVKRKKENSDLGNKCVCEDSYRVRADAPNVTQSHVDDIIILALSLPNKHHVNKILAV